MAECNGYKLNSPTLTDKSLFIYLLRQTLQIKPILLTFFYYCKPFMALCEVHLFFCCYILIYLAASKPITNGALNPHSMMDRSYFLFHDRLIGLFGTIDDFYQCVVYIIKTHVVNAVCPHFHLMICHHPNGCRHSR